MMRLFGVVYAWGYIHMLHVLYLVYVDNRVRV